MTATIPTINFGTLERYGASQLCIVIDANDMSISETDALAQTLRAKNLECLDAKDKNEYAEHFHLTRGIVVFAKKHEPSDADHSFGMDLGMTVKEAFDHIKETFQKRYQSVQLSSLAYENLQTFLKSFDEIGLEAAQEAMPELEGIQSVLSNLKSSGEKNQQLWYWLTAACVLFTAIYCWNYLFQRVGEDII